MSKWVSFDQNIILLLYLEIQVRFIYPEHVMIMKCEDPEEVEEDDDEDKVCVYYSSSNNRNHHFSQLEDEPVVCYPR